MSFARGARLWYRRAMRNPLLWIALGIGGYFAYTKLTEKSDKAPTPTPGGGGGGGGAAVVEGPWNPVDPKVMSAPAEAPRMYDRGETVYFIAEQPSTGSQVFLSATVAEAGRLGDVPVVTGKVAKVMHQIKGTSQPPVGASLIVPISNLVSASVVESMDWS